jgi:hypothetical protein
VVVCPVWALRVFYPICSAVYCLMTAITSDIMLNMLA